MKDIERCQKEVDELAKLLARGQAKDKAKKATFDVLSHVLNWIKEEKKWISHGVWKAAEVEVLNEFQFLTAKPMVYLVNLSAKDFIRQKNKFLAGIKQWVTANHPGTIIPYSAEFEMKLADLPTEVERLAYIKEAGAVQSQLSRIINTGYSSLHLLHFFTCGEDEVKCWTVREATKAPAAAGTIHTDFERGFICAEVYKFVDIKEKGSEAALKAAGKYLQKGKDYVVEDGDIIFFKFNVSGGGKK
eukprot:GHVT01045232.1.p1 GENE.GHVT01045232.1~~GHVT01045232.1.p1  ORF type:complete len:245 (+),score=49.30 GHVT01045232.1:586-1320(+)